MAEKVKITIEIPEYDTLIEFEVATFSLNTDCDFSRVHSLYSADMTLVREVPVSTLNATGSVVYKKLSKNKPKVEQTLEIKW